MKAWLKKHGAGSSEVPVYVSHLREMLNQPSFTTYEEKLQEFQVLWSEPFCRYYMDEIHPEVSMKNPSGHYLVLTIFLYIDE